METKVFKDVQSLDKMEKKLTPRQLAIYRQLKGKKIHVSNEKVKQDFSCFICGGKGNNAVEVEDEKGKKRLAGKTCLSNYYGIEIKGNSGAGRKVNW